jgi:hypothetical protein
MLRESVVRGISEDSGRLDGPHLAHRGGGRWRSALLLNEDRVQQSGSESELIAAIRSGADLRVGSGFRHHEHIEVGSSCREQIHEVIDFRVTYLLDRRWTAGVCNLRMPVQPPEGFGPRESMSFFMYNQDGQQAIARPHLDGAFPLGEMPHRVATNGHSDIANMPRYQELDRCDDETNAPSSNFVYKHDYFNFCVSEHWREVLSHTAEGHVREGSIDDLVAAFHTGAELKVAIRGLCDDLHDGKGPPMDHEVFIHLGSCYYYTSSRLFMAAAHPVVRIAPTIPLAYRSRGWDFGWLLPRTDGHLARWLCNPYSLKFHKSESRHAMRWFVGV